MLDLGFNKRSGTRNGEDGVNVENKQAEFDEREKAENEVTPGTPTESKNLGQPNIEVRSPYVKDGTIAAHKSDDGDGIYESGEPIPTRPDGTIPCEHWTQEQVEAALLHPDLTEDQKYQLERELVHTHGVAVITREDNGNGVYELGEPPPRSGDSLNLDGLSPQEIKDLLAYPDLEPHEIGTLQTRLHDFEALEISKFVKLSELLQMALR